MGETGKKFITKIDGHGKLQILFQKQPKMKITRDNFN